jgi:hypothetical protein
VSDEEIVQEFKDYAINCIEMKPVLESNPLVAEIYDNGGEDRLYSLMERAINELVGIICD